ncbi:protein of unknown function [Streptomyces murinus]
MAYSSVIGNSFLHIWDSFQPASRERLIPPGG